jgi:Fe2+ transport system protein FeoA
MSGKTLAELSVGARARVIDFNLSSELKQRFMEMGLTKGVECQLVRFAPLGDPVEVRVRGYNLSLRKSEAQGILVDPL